MEQQEEARIDTVRNEIWVLMNIVSDGCVQTDLVSLQLAPILFMIDYL